MSVHTGEKPFKCWYCDYATDRNTSLKSHCLRKHEMEDFEFQEKMKEVKLLRKQEKKKKKEAKKEVKITTKDIKPDTSTPEKDK